MKNKILYKGLLLISALGGIITGCTKTVEEHLTVDTSVFTFMAEPDGNKTINIESNPAWSVDAKGTESWLHIVEQTKNTLVLSADVNDTGANRSTTITINAGSASRIIKVEQNIVDVSSARYRIMSQFIRTRISPNGKLAGGWITVFDEDGQMVFTPIIIDIETDKWHELGNFTAKQMIIQDANCMTDDGNLFLSDGDAGKLFRFSREEAGSYETMNLPSEYISQPYIEHSGDGGRVWVGFSMKSAPDINQYYPLKWVDGQIEELPRPALNFRDEPFWSGVMARGCSADGSVIYGTTWENADQGMVYWKDGKVDYVWRDKIEDSYFIVDGVKKPYKLVNGMISTGASPYQASASGKYLCGTYRIEEMDANREQIVTTYCPAFFNTETKEIHKFTDYTANGGGSALFALDNGIGFVATPYNNCQSGFVVEIETGAVLGTIQTWILEKYGINMPGGAEYITYISPDESVVLGTKPISGDSAPSWYIAPPIKK